MSTNESKGRVRKVADLIQQPHPAELFISGKTEDFRRAHGFVCGSWQLDAHSKTLEHKPTGYFIPLDQCLTAHGALDWLCQVGRKVSFSDGDFRDLFRAINDIVRPQANLRGPEPWEPEWVGN